MDVVRKAQVVLVDDHPVFRRGLAAVLREEPDLEIAGEAAAADEALAIARDRQIDLAVVDVLLPRISGVSLVAELRELQPGCKVLGLSVIDEPCVIADLLRAGACGHALKRQPPREIIDAIRQVLGGVRYLAPEVEAAHVDGELERGDGARDRPIERLTRREREVFELLIRGYSNDEISSHLFISRRTVETHRQRITRKLATHSIVELQRVAARYGGLLA